MFVESMSFEELRKEFDKEKNIILTKLTKHSEKVQRQMRKVNMTQFDKYYESALFKMNRVT